MAPSVDCSAASLLCCEDVSSCLFDDGEQEGGGFLHLLGENSSSWHVTAAMELEDPSDVEAALSALVKREIFHLPRPDYAQKYQSKLLDAGSRQKAISWLFKVRAFYNFGSLTATLSVNYLDRFLSLHQLPNGKAWMIQLLSVACLSLAAKMEETEVPLLLDLQVGPDCIFEPRTIQRMELLVLSTLEWRMSSVTPFSYIDYFICKFGLVGSTHCVVSARISELVLSAVQELKFLYFRPSSIAAAATLCAIQEILPLRFAELKRILLSMLTPELQDPSKRCFMLMAELFLAPLSTLSKGETCANWVPQSPLGVLDASFSCDSESTFKSVGSDASVQISSPAPKKRKVDDFCNSMKVCAS